MSQSKEESISPMTRSPLLESPGLINGNGSVALRPSGLRSQLGFDGQVESRESPTTNGNSVKLVEAADYMNGGIAHTIQEPTSPITTHPIDTGVPPQKASALKQSSAPSSAFPQDALTSGLGTSTPPGRRSVQFARPDRDAELSHIRQDSWQGEDGEAGVKDRRGQSLMSKLKALASTSGNQTHSRNQSNAANSIDEETVSAPLTPAADRGTRFPRTLEEEGSDVDADAE